MQFIVHYSFFWGKKKPQTKTSTQVKYANIALFTAHFELHCKVMNINLQKKKYYMQPIYIPNY